MWCWPLTLLPWTFVVYRSNWSQLDPKFQVERVAPTNYSSQKTRLNDLSCGIKIWTDLSSVLSQCTRLTDGRTEFSSLDRVCIPCSAVKTKKAIHNEVDIEYNYKIAKLMHTNLVNNNVKFCEAIVVLNKLHFSLLKYALAHPACVCCIIIICWTWIVHW